MTPNEVSRASIYDLMQRARYALGHPSTSDLYGVTVELVDALEAAAPDHQAGAVVRRNEWADGSYQEVYPDGSTGPWEPATDRQAEHFHIWSELPCRGGRCPNSGTSNHQAEAPSEREPFDIAREVFDPAFTPRQNMVRAIEADRAARPVVDDAAVERGAEAISEMHASSYVSDYDRMVSWTVLSAAYGAVPEQSPHPNEQEQGHG